MVISWEVALLLLSFAVALMVWLPAVASAVFHWYWYGKLWLCQLQYCRSEYYFRNIAIRIGCFNQYVNDFSLKQFITIFGACYGTSWCFVCHFLLLITAAGASMKKKQVLKQQTMVLKICTCH